MRIRPRKVETTFRLMSGDQPLILLRCGSMVQHHISTSMVLVFTVLNLCPESSWLN